MEIFIRYTLSLSNNWKRFMGSLCSNTVFRLIYVQIKLIIKILIAFGCSKFAVEWAGCSAFEWNSWNYQIYLRHMHTKRTQVFNWIPKPKGEVSFIAINLFGSGFLLISSIFKSTDNHSAFAYLDESFNCLKFWSHI